MGIEVPEQFGGAGGSLFMVDARRRGDQQGRRVGRDPVRRAEHARQLPDPPLRQRRAEASATSRASPPTPSAPTRSPKPAPAPTRSDSQTRAEKNGDGWILNGPQAVDHQRRRGGASSSSSPTPIRRRATRASPRSSSSAASPGFTVGKKEDKLGIRASSTAELLLDGCEVPAANVLGPVGQGYKIAIETLNEGRIGIGAQMIGVAQGALDAAIAYMKERKQFGKALARLPGDPVPDRAGARRSSRPRGSWCTTRRGSRTRATTSRAEGAMAKLFSSQVAERVTSLCVELFGGYGYTKDYPVEKFYRDAKIGTIYEGTSQHAAADDREVIAPIAVRRRGDGCPLRGLRSQTTRAKTPPARTAATARSNRYRHYVYARR